MKKWLVTALVALGVTGCSSTHYLSDTERNELYQDYIAEQQLKKRHVAKQLELESWAPLTDDYLLMTADLRRQYLVKVSGTCGNISDASQIALIRGRIHVLDGLKTRCPILAMYEVSKEQAKDISALGRMDGDSAEEKMLNSAEKPS